MTTKKKLALILSSILLLCFLCALPFGYNAYIERKRYQIDENTVIVVATRLGYSANNHIRLYRQLSTILVTSDVIGLAFFTEESFQPFTSKVEALGFTTLSYTNNSGKDEAFLQTTVNFDEPEKKLTLSNYYSVHDFRSGQPAPIVTEWVLQDAQRRNVTIYYAQTPTTEDVWRYGDQPITSKIVVVEFNRQGPFTQVDATEFWVVTGLIFIVATGCVVFYFLWMYRRKTGTK
jgi:hypothetical protein